MEVFSWTFSLIVLISSLTIYLMLLKKQRPRIKLPPGPPKLPLVGNLHQLASKNTLPHRRLAELATVYGPIMHLKLGEVSTVVISSAEVAKEVLKTHDAVLCDRPKLLMPQVVFYNSSDIALAPYGEYWRQIRKIATLELFTASRVQAFRCFREDAVMEFFKSQLLPPSKAGNSINLTPKIFALTFDITLRLAVNKKGEDGEEFRKIVADMAAAASGFSIGDLYPSIKFLSVISGMKRKLQMIVKRIDKIMDPIIEEHLCNKGQGKEDGDIVDTLLNYLKVDDLNHNNEFSLTTENIKAIVFELFGAGGETSSTVIDWAMCELLKNPSAMDKAQNEVRRVFQQDKEIMIDKASLDKLEYLKLVIKETLRLHTPLPFLVPRESMERCEINGYEIPPNTRVFINAWTIGRDSKYWKDPQVFNPERFESSSINYKGTYYELIPFGAGRRICPGMGLGLATVELILAMLLYHFDWKLPHGSKPEDLNMDETFGIVARRKNDLHVIPILYCSNN